MIGAVGRRVRLLVVFATAAIWATSVQAEQRQTITFKVLDGNGKPVAGATASTHWSAETATVERHARDPKTVTDVRGAGRLRIYWTGEATVLYAEDAGRKRGGMALITKDSVHRQLTIVLRPLIDVVGRLTCSNRPAAVQDVQALLLVRFGKHRARFCFNDPSTGTIRMRLPPGRYEYLTSPELNARSASRSFALSVDEPRHDLGTIDLELTTIARHYGKAPPVWTVTDAKGGRKSVSAVRPQGAVGAH